jgi:hypothetical protein
MSTVRLSLSTSSSLSMSLIECGRVVAIALRDPSHLAAQGPFVLGRQIPEVVVDGLREETVIAVPRTLVTLTGLWR